MTRLLLLLLLAVFFALGVTIGFYNAQPVRFSYIFGEVEVPLIVLIVGEFLLAVLVTLLVVAGRVLSLRAELRRTHRQLRSLEAELSNLRQVSQPASATTHNV